MSLSLGIGLGLTMQRVVRWWDAFEAGGFTATLILSFNTAQYYNGGGRALANLITCSRSTTKTTINASGFIAEVAANTPAITYDPVTLERLGVVSEPAATNLIPYSAIFPLNGYWSPGGTATLAVDATGPDGDTSAVTLVDSSAGGTGFVSTSTSAVTVATATTHTYSLFAKADQLTGIMMFANAFTTPGSVGWYFDLSAGVVSDPYAGGGAGLTPRIEDYGNGWYRCSITFTTDATDTSGNLLVYVSDMSGTPTITVDLDGTSSVLIYGMQYEEGSVPSSHIPTDGTQITRNADELSVVVAGSDPYIGYDQTKVSGKLTITPRVDGALTYISYNDTTANEVIKVHQDASNNIMLTVTDGGIDQCAIDSGVNAVVGTEVTIAFRAGVNDFAISVDGNAEVADTGGTMPTVTQQEFGGAGIVAEEVAYNELIVDLAGLSA